MRIYDPIVPIYRVVRDANPIAPFVAIIRGEGVKRFATDWDAWGYLNDRRREDEAAKKRPGARRAA